MDNLAASDVLSVGESCHLGMLGLHGLDFAPACLTVLDAVAQLGQLHALGCLPQAFFLQTVPLTGDDLAHVSVLAERPIGQRKLVVADEVFRLEVLYVLCHCVVYK